MMKRRAFIKSACLSCAGSIGFTWLLQACTSQKYITNYQLSHGKLVIKKSDFVIVKKEKVIYRKFLLLKTDSLEFPIIVYQIAENDYKTLSLKCTHQGCELIPYDTTMVCPCHGAEFNNKGEVTTGPADSNLKSFLTTHDNENIYIQL